MGVAIQVPSKRVEKTRRLIIDNASKIFFKQGFRNISVEELCKLVGVSKVTFYKNFPNREALVETIFEEAIAEAGPAITKNFNSGLDIGHIIETHYSLLLELFLSRISAQILADMEVLMPQSYNRFEEMRRYNSSKMIKLIKSGQKEGLIRKDVDPEVASILLEEVIANVTRPDFMISNNLTLQQVGSTIKNVFLHGIIESNE